MVEIEFVVPKDKLNEYLKTIPQPNLDKLEFGKAFAPFMFTAKYHQDKGWYEAKIEPYTKFSLAPGALVFHYGQEIFEGQKAYKWDDGTIAMFRPWENVKRFNKSAKRLVMPEIPEDLYLKGLKEMVYYNKNWIPNKFLYSLYVRPTMIATEEVLGVRSSKEYIFFIIGSPVGAYLDLSKPITIYVTNKYSRAVKGGTGEAKAGGNYAAGLIAKEEAKKYGAGAVLWLDACEHKYIEEVGTMNIFFVKDGKVITPELDGAILEGITRKSIIQIAKDLGYNVEERKITIEEIIKGIEEGTVTEAFGSGTALVVPPVGRIIYNGKEYVISNTMGQITKKIFETLTGIQYGRKEDKYNWIYKVYAPNNEHFDTIKI